jgi:hypothetical protein
MRTSNSFPTFRRRLLLTGSSLRNRARASETRDRRHGRRWYAKRLLAIAEGNATPTKKQLTALLTLGRLNGWHRRSR